jgi:hypothetical protein
MGPRETNGRLSRKLVEAAARRAGEPPEGLSPTLIKRTLDVIASFGTQRWGTPVGRMSMDGRLTQMQFAAAMWWDKIVTDYRQATGAASPDPKAAEIGRGQGGREIDPESEAGQRIAARDAGVVKKFLTCHAAVVAEGTRTEATLRQCCEGNGRFPLGYEELMRLRLALDIVSRHMTLT